MSVTFNNACCVHLAVATDIAVEFVNIINMFLVTSLHALPKK